MCKKLIKLYLKSLTKQQRSTRLILIGKRLKVKQYQWLHDHGHPWESKE